LPHPEIIEASEVGHVLLIDDGKVKVRVVGKGQGYLDTEVEVPGRIKDKKVSAFSFEQSYSTVLGISLLLIYFAHINFWNFLSSFFTYFNTRV
jgi:hypothetical protein